MFVTQSVQMLLAPANVRLVGMASVARTVL